MAELLLLVLRTFVAAVRSRRDLALENLVLRHQLQVALRTNPHPHLRAPDRVLWVWLRHLWAEGWRRPSPCGPAGDGSALAPEGLATLLDVEVANPTPSTPPHRRVDGAHRPGLPGESALGDRTHPG